MGNDNNSSPELYNSVGPSSTYSVKTFHYQIDKFYTTQLTKHQFVHQLFAVIDSKPHPHVGRLTVCNTYILERLYLYLTDNQQGQPVNCAKMKSFVQKIYTNPEKAIQKSFCLIDLDGDRFITDAQFLSFMDNCFLSLMVAVEKSITDNSFRVNFKDWVMKHKKQFYDYVLGVFQKHKKSDPRNWNYNDFKRWVLSGQNWTLDIEIGEKKFRTPLNILCLFAVPLK